MALNYLVRMFKINDDEWEMSLQLISSHPDDNPLPLFKSKFKTFWTSSWKKKFWQKFEKLIFYLLSFGKAFLWKQFKNLLTGVETHQKFQSFIILRWKFIIIKAINLKSLIIVQKRERALELASCYFKDKKVRNTFLQISN